MKPLVSCLITAYNYGHLIGRAIDSALAQDYGAEHLDVLVVDDGSTDDTAAAVAAYGDRVRYVRQDNAGLAATVNTAIALGSGEFLAMLDADDEWPADKVRRQVDLFAGRPEVGIVYSDMETIDLDGNVIDPSYFGMLGITPPRGWIHGALLERNYVCSTMMIRASLREVFHPIDPRSQMHDWPIAAAVSRVAQIDLVDAPIYRYRQHGANMNLGTDGVKRLRVLRAENQLRRKLLAEVEPHEASERELLAGLATLDYFHAMTADGLGVPVGEVAATDDGQRAAAESAVRDAITADRHTAVCRLANAIALDPLIPGARAALRAVLERPAPAPLAGTRGFAVLAFADELVERPELLAAYGARFGAADDATLVIYAPGWDDARVGGELPPVLAAAGIGDDGADLLALPVESDPQHELQLARSVRAVLSARPAAEPFAARPAYAADGVPRLRRLAERSWAA